MTALLALATRGCRSAAARSQSAVDTSRATLRFHKRALHTIGVAPPRCSPSPAVPFDLAVVGGGIVGLACARELALRHPHRRICVLEKESALATHQSARNSGVIHAGIYYKPNSQRAQLCAVGARMMIDYCEKRSLPVKKVGQSTVAHGRIRRRRRAPRLG